MLQGTGSDAGKSLLVAGLCRFFANNGIKPKPFKPQNMSNNAAITADGGEIGRAQVTQARACRVEPTVDMNPVLLKPESDTGSQVVLHGKAVVTKSANDYIAYRNTLLQSVLDSFGRLRDTADVVVVEGAGSISEVNLRDGDIANMGFASAAQVPVVLVADIDRGGAIASIVGSYLLLSDAEKPLLKGYIINKFRGDYEVFKPAEKIIMEHTGLPCLGSVPWFEGADLLPAEDSLALENRRSGKTPPGKMIKIYVLGLSRISNFDDFDPLAAEPDVSLSFIRSGDPVPGDGDLIIIPGTKSTIADLAFIRKQGWDIDIAAHIRRGGMVVGICGGYQILGRGISDPHGIENPEPLTVAGLGLLDVVTVMSPEKTLKRFKAVTNDNMEISGYEIHLGVTSGRGTDRPMLYLDGVPEGALRSDGLVAGCYIHGLFTNDEYRAKFLSSFRGGDGFGAARLCYENAVEGALDELSYLLADHLDMKTIAKIAGLANFRF
ncbi:MAG: cobyric acid synthase [Synergistaceae bacterium]|jgi:adenosylcobyric acid synthase|nr:cobyric acid synthase [Synergistaceae bacterium]